VQNVEEIRAMRPGRNLVLSIDLRIQYLAYRELKAAIRDQRAKSGSAIVIDVATGEVLAMVNQPTYNPNDRDQIKAKAYRNRAVTDIVEPGSSMKPFVVAAGLASGRFDDHSIIDTNPGYIKVGAKLLEDRKNYGAINLATCLAESSNICLTKVALALEPAQMYGTLNGLGFGQVTTSGYPGESAGLLPHYSHWRPVGISSMSRGYGLSVTPLQLAHAYATVASYGVSRPISFLRVDTPPPGERVLEADVSRMLVHLLEAVVAPDGGGAQAAIPGYTVAGKTGTARKPSTTHRGYVSGAYIATFAGFVPAEDPRLSAIVVLDEPHPYYASLSSAPVFAKITKYALRQFRIPPPAAAIATVGAPPEEAPGLEVRD
jgi:cell division protein FtsI (penicillin-binding protein 3)